METKFTKGKWSCEISNKFSNEFYLHSDTDRFVYGNQEANALLISKAPEMLEMLQRIYKIENGAFGLKGFDVKRLKSEIEQLLKEATEL